MTLHETYTALIRRGMPEHPRLQHVSADFCAWSLAYPITSVANAQDHRCGVNIDDARDLVTMHAERHLLAKYAGVTVEARRGLAGVPVWYRIVTYDDVLLAEGKYLLDAILAAMEHLEPVVS